MTASRSVLIATALLIYSVSCAGQGAPQGGHMPPPGGQPIINQQAPVVQQGLPPSHQGQQHQQPPQVQPQMPSEQLSHQQAQQMAAQQLYEQQNVPQQPQVHPQQSGQPQLQQQPLQHQVHQMPSQQGGQPQVMELPRQQQGGQPQMGNAPAYQAGQPQMQHQQAGQPQMHHQQGGQPQMHPQPGQPQLHPQQAGQNQMHQMPSQPPVHPQVQQGYPPPEDKRFQQLPDSPDPVRVEPGYGQGPAAFIAGYDDGGTEFDQAPGVAMEYKVHVEAGREDCYWQYVHQGATFYVSSQVLKGGDGAIGVGIRQPNGLIVHPYSWKPNAEYEEGKAEGGYYSICLDNQFSKYSAKLVNLYITTFRYDEWEKFAAELKDMDMSASNMTEIMSNVDKRIQVVRQLQQLSRAMESRDYNTIVESKKYVDRWSFVQCAVVIACGFVQVYFVRHLFDSNTKSKSQMRA